MRATCVIYCARFHLNKYAIKMKFIVCYLLFSCGVQHVIIVLDMILIM